MTAGGSCNFFLGVFFQRLFSLSLPEALAIFFLTWWNIFLYRRRRCQIFCLIWEIFVSFCQRRCQNASRFGKSLSHSAGGAAKILPDLRNIYFVPPEALPKLFQTRGIFILFCRRCCQNSSRLLKSLSCSAGGAAKNFAWFRRDSAQILLTKTSLPWYAGGAAQIFARSNLLILFCQRRPTFCLIHNCYICKFRSRPIFYHDG